MNEYTPQPTNTTGIMLSDDLLGLTEHLAKNTHEIWALGRMSEGWTWGPERDDKAKKHPGLVPYDKLSESEKDYDRNTAVETLKLIVAMGYAIEKRR